jgi:hypothetical protein
MAVRTKDLTGADEPPPSPSPERAITITPSELRALVAEQVAEATASGGLGLPPGAYRGADGAVYRDVQVPTGRVREIKNADGRVVRTQAVLRTVARTVLLVQETSPSGVRAALKAAKLRATTDGPDVYHPRWKCWFKWGSKRQVDLPENLGELGNGGAVEFLDILPDPAASVLLSDIEDSEEN